MNYINQVKWYFKNKAGNYDLVEGQLYWKLSDDLLWETLKSQVLNKLGGEEIKILDAGGGTGRWLIRIIKEMKGSSGVIYDLSNDMLQVAREKVSKLKISDRVKLVNGNIERMSDQESSQYDIVICFHNVLGFVQNIQGAFREMSRVLKKGGYLVMVLPNKYHTIFFNMSVGRFKVLDDVVIRDIGSFTNSMPKIRLFTPNYVRSLYKSHNFSNVRVYGFPITIYPNIKETRIVGNTETIKDILSRKKLFKKIKNIELKLILEEEAAARGNNLLSIGVK